MELRLVREKDYMQIAELKWLHCEEDDVDYNATNLVKDDVVKLMETYDWADKIVSVSPSYWADIPGQFKVFIDRCTLS